MNLECVKVWGPRRNFKEKTEDFVTPSLPIIKPLYAINDISFTPEDSHFYNKFYCTFSKYEPAGSVWWFPTFLQNMWKDYGSTFSNDCLMSASLAASYCPFPHLSGVGQPEEIEIDRHLSRFYVSLMKALDRKAISELHLFAISVVISIQLKLSRNGESLEPHLWGFGAVLQFLIGKKKHLVYSNGEWRPNHLFAFLLIYVRCIATIEVQHAHISRERGHALLCDLGNLSSYFERPSSASDSRIAFAFPKQSLRTWDYGHFFGLAAALSSIEVDLYQFALERFSPESSEPASSTVWHVQRNLLRSAEGQLKMIRDMEVVKDVFSQVTAFTLVVLTRRSPDRTTIQSSRS